MVTPHLLPFLCPEVQFVCLLLSLCHLFDEENVDREQCFSVLHLGKYLSQEVNMFLAYLDK